MAIEQDASTTLDASLAPETATVEFPHINQRQRALDDVNTGFANWRIWLMLAYQDIKLRYRRSILGPFWITLSMAITVYTMGYLYSHLFHIELKDYFPFLVGGMLTWSLISTLVTDMTDGLVTSDAFIKQIKLPYTLYIHRIACRNMLIFFHNIVVIIPIWLIYHDSIKMNAYDLLMIPGLAILYINAMTYGLALAMLGARFRDISQIIKSLVQVIFFVTPVMWNPVVLGDKHAYIVDLNPFYAFIELVRAPLLGTMPSSKSLGMVALITALGFYISGKLFTRYRSRIVYWL